MDVVVDDDDDDDADKSEQLTYDVSCIWDNFWQLPLNEISVDEHTLLTILFLDEETKE